MTDARDPPKRRGEQVEFVLARARTAPDQGDPAKAMGGFQSLRIHPGALEDARLDRHARDEGQTKPIVDHLHERVKRSAHHRGVGANLGPVAGGQRMVLEAMTVLEQEQAVFVDLGGLHRCAMRRFARGEGDIERVVE